MSGMEVSRRSFLRRAAAAAVASPLVLSGAASLIAAADEGDRYVREAKYYELLGEKKVKCLLCPHECRVADLERGTCGVRENRGGTYYTLVYGNPCSCHVDPIEKKPLFHYYPGTRAFSIATAGCNFVCRFCQNWEISQKRPEQVNSLSLFPDDVISAAKKSFCKTVAHTYTEPVVFFEYMLECASSGKKNNVPNVMISNGYINEKPMRELCKYLGAVKIDLKAFTEKFYRESCSGTLKPVLDTLVVLKEENIWFEIVDLLIPTLNDSADEIDRMTKWIVKELGPDVPVHFTRFYPAFMLRNLPPTPPEIMRRARKIAMDNGVRFAYIGNLLSRPGDTHENTYCPGCGKLLIERLRYAVNLKGMKGGACGNCGQAIPGVFQ